MQNLLNKLNVERDIAIETRAEYDETVLMYVMANNDPELQAVLSHQCATGLIDAFNVVEKWLKQPITIYVVACCSRSDDEYYTHGVFVDKADADKLYEHINSGALALERGCEKDYYEGALVEEHHLTFPTI